MTFARSWAWGRIRKLYKTDTQNEGRRKRATRLEVYLLFLLIFFCLAICVCVYIATFCLHMVRSIVFSYKWMPVFSCLCLCILCNVYITDDSKMKNRCVFNSRIYIEKKWKERLYYAITSSIYAKWHIRYTRSRSYTHTNNCRQ